jgi:high-affinity K+ transport system ATPase subunit B
MSFGDVFWPMVWFALYASYLTVLFHIVRDLFADPDSSGWSKALWVLLLLLVPVLAALAYLIAHGRTMALRTSVRAETARREADEHARRTAAASPAEQISLAKAMLEDGTLTRAEFDTLKARALSSPPQ